MKKYIKYLFIITLFVSSVSLFSEIIGKADFTSLPDLDEVGLQPNDTLPRYPVKKTQVTTFDDLQNNPPVDLKTPSNITNTIEYDPTSGLYVFRSKVGDMEVATPFSLNSDEYMDYTLKRSMADYFKEKNKETYDKKDNKDEFSLKDVKLNLGPAEKLFGPGGVQVKTQGYVEALMGINRQSTDNPTLSERSKKRTSFEFKENIQLNVTASVGDKISFGMNYDTKAMFDFDARKIKLGYDPKMSGDEDGILRHIEAGNVSMNTTNSLINGGTALFGISAGLQFGKLNINTVVSQQEAQSQTINTKGGVQTKTFEFKADQYESSRHFFMSHYFRDNYDKAVSKLPLVQSTINITRVEVWVTNKRNNYNQSRNILAFADLGEPLVIKNPAQWQPTGVLNIPSNDANTLYSSVTTTYSAIRNFSETGILNNIIVSSQDYEKVESARLLNTSEYSFNPQLGYLSLNFPLQADEVLGVAFEYMKDAKTYKVGEFSNEIIDKYDPSNPKSGTLFVRMLKPISLSPHSYTWDLMMKNIYNIGASAMQQDRFKLNISYQSDTLGTYINYLTEGKVKNQLLLRVMNLDRLNSKNQPVKSPKDPNIEGDGVFDFVEGYTVNSQYGRIIFPVIEPFGSHLAKKIGDDNIAKKYIYQELYDSTLTIAQQIAEKNKFKIYGSYRGGSSGTGGQINLNAINIPQGSVRLTSGGRQLTEGIDYIVDYTSGTATIINQNLLDTEAPIQASLEDRSLNMMQRKTMLGLNLSYDISKKFNIGGTVMHLYEKPLTTKAEFGNESVKNTLWGVNTSYKTESLWLTNLVDKLPFVNAKQPSQITFSAEFAHMIPGHYENKEAGGYSYLDDFETSESRIDVKNPYAWSLASIPSDKSADALFPEAQSDSIENGMNRAMLSWFMIDPLFTRQGSSLTPNHIKEDLSQLSNHFVREIQLTELYPKKDISHNESATIPTLNLTYYPNERGPYNLDNKNINSDGKLLFPEKRWGGITRKMDVPDFEMSNIEYIEFWLMDPFAVNESEPFAPVDGGDLYINLGEISEDVLKDNRKFYENGLPINDDPTAVENTVWGKVPKLPSTVYAFDNKLSPEDLKKQDVGLNGLSIAEEFEHKTYKAYLEGYLAKLSEDAKAQLAQDEFSPLNAPAGDKYHFYRGSDYDAGRVSILDRYKYYNNTEGNTTSTSDTNENYSTASRSVPDVEDINQDNTLNQTESYFQYKIALKPGEMMVGNKYIVGSREVLAPLRNQTERKVTWYQFKIPVRQYDKRVGNIQDFKSIRFMRMFLTNFKQTAYLRFGAFQLVRGDWRVYQQTLNKNNTPSGIGSIDLATVNVEADSERKPVSYVLPPGVSRVLDPSQTQMIKENEQALSMRITNLESGDARAVYKNTSYDMRRYKRIQLFTHAEEQIGGTTLTKGDLTVFIRLGSDYKNNYYEYEIPLAVTPEGDYKYTNVNDRYIVWPNDNMFDFPLELLKNVKLSRNREKRKAGSSISYTTLYSEYDPEKPNNKISIIGNPSLSEVNVIMIGVRNNTRVAKSGEVWVNELRLTDFDEEGGWAAQGNLHIALSDLGSITMSGRKETIGFGALDQSLQERRSDDFSMYNISANVELGKFFPEKAKVSLPLYYSYSNQTTTPKYDPFDQDVTLSESLSIMETKAEKDSIKSLSQEKNTMKSISLNNIKVNVQSKTPMPYDPANFSLGYTYTQSEIKSPTTVYDVNKNYKAVFGYAYTPMLKSWEPFKKTKSTSATAKFAKSLGFNYLPNNILFNTNISRIYNETALRDIDSYSLGGTNDSQFLTWSQSFLWDRDFSLNWDFTKNIVFSFQSGTRAEIEEPYMQVNKKMNPGDYEIWKDSVVRSIKSLGNPLSYRQSAKLRYTLPTKNISILDWITSSADYSSNYQWDRGAVIDGSELGNAIENNMSLEFKSGLNLTGLYNKWGFLKKVNERFDVKRRPQQTRPNANAQRNDAERKQQQQRSKRIVKEVSIRKDSAISVVHGLKTKDLKVTALKEGKPYPIKFKKTNENSILITNKDSVNIRLTIETKVSESDSPKILKEVVEYSARGLMSLRTMNLSYSRRNETMISGFKPGIGDAFGQKGSEYGMSPGLGFAFGLEGGEDFVQKSLDYDWVVKNGINITPATYNQIETFDAKAQLEPFNKFKIELSAKYQRNKRTEIQHMVEGAPHTFGGNLSMTTIALSTSLKGSNADNNYQSDAFDNFLKNRTIIKDQLESKYRQTSYPGGGFMDESENQKWQGQPYSPDALGAVDANSPDVLIPSFLAAYTGKKASGISTSMIPSLLSVLPNWSMSYDGLSSVSFIKNTFKSIRINHAYFCLYQIGDYSSYSNWLQAGDDLGYIRDILSGSPMPSSPYSVGSVTITEKFDPLFGVDGTLLNNMTIKTRYNSSRNLTLNMSSFQIIESNQKEFVFGLAYRISEFDRIIGLQSKKSKNFNNDLDVKADLSYKSNDILLRKIEENFTQATNGINTLKLMLSADYTFSRALTLRMFFDRIMNKPLISSQSYPTTNSNFGISLKFTLIQ